MRLILTLTLILPSMTLAAEHSVQQVQPLVVKVNRIGTEYIQFQVCDNGPCGPLAGETGIFRISDLEARQDSLTNGSAEYHAAWAARQKLLNLAAAIGTGVVVIGNAGAAYLDSKGLVMPAFITALASDAGLVPMTLAFWTKFLTRSLDERPRQARGHALMSAMGEKFETESTEDFRRNIAKVRSALYGLKTVSECEAATL